jgi:hypothetical protein
VARSRGEEALALWERVRVQAGYRPGSGMEQLEAERTMMRDQGVGVPSNHLTPFGW